MRALIRRISVLVIGLALIGAVAYGLMELAIDRYYYPEPPQADYPAPANRLEARQQDLDYFRHFLNLDRSYTGVTRNLAEAVLAEMEPRLADMTDAGFQLGIARAVAAADNGHSNIWLGRFSREHGRLPIRFYWFADGVYVVRAREGHADLVGAELLSVGGVPVLEAGVRLKDFFGGTWEAFRAYRGPILLELPAAHYAAGISDSERASTLTFRLSDDSLVVRRIAAEDLDEGTPLFWPGSYLLASLPEPESTPWIGLASRVGDLPFYLREADKSFRLAALPAGGLYLQYRANSGEGIVAFGEGVRERVAAKPPSYLVLDQRFNGGGDYTLTADLMRDLPALIPDAAPIYVLTGPATFSAGINSTAFIKSTGGEQVILVGERIGDRERSWGETNEFELPNSRLGITFSTGLHDVANGCPPFPECYFRNYFYDVAVGSLDPDVPVDTDFVDYMSGSDPVLERVLDLNARD